jgi:hypothetical protein
MWLCGGISVGVRNALVEVVGAGGGGSRLKRQFRRMTGGRAGDWIERL